MEPQRFGRVCITELQDLDAWVDKPIEQKGGELQGEWRNVIPGWRSTAMIMSNVYPCLSAVIGLSHGDR
eukprot:3700-Eustigmatos_ZCMA.PRE.1